MDNFQKTMILQATGSKVFHALTNFIPQWWTETFEGVANIQGETFTIRFGANIFKTMRVEELIPNKKVVWVVTGSLIDLPELINKTEWIDTRIIWEITENDTDTTLLLTHLGLTPEIECYSICESGWNSFTNSLKAFLETGKGNPFKP